MKRTKIIYMFLMSPPHEKLISKFNSIEDYTTHYAQSVGDLHYLDVNEEVRRVFFYLQDFCHLLMKEILSRTNDYELEIWRSYLGITQVYTKEVEGITHRLFPAKKVKKITGSYKTHSNDLLTRLKKTIKTENVLLITSYPSQYTTCFLLKLKPVNVPLIAIHRGWRLARFKSPTKTKFDIIEKLNDSLEIKCFRKYIDVFRCNIRKQIDYLKNEKGLENVAQFTDGIDYNFYKPCEDKERLKQELNLPCNKKILLYIGKFTKIKDVDFLIDTYLELLKTRIDILLVLVGGTVDDEFYNLGKDAGAVMVERTNQQTLLKFNQVADLYILPTRNYIVKNFGGIGASVIQSLACGVPVISDNLAHFSGSIEERKKIGFLLENKMKLVENTHLLLDKPFEKEEIRRISKKYYDKDTNTDVLLKYLSDLSNKYYGLDELV